MRTLITWTNLGGFTDTYMRQLDLIGISKSDWTKYWASEQAGSEIWFGVLI